MVPTSGRIRVLYVAGDSATAERTATELERADDALVVTPRVVTELTDIDATAYEVVVTAQTLGSTTGLELLREVRKRCPEQPVILYPTDGSEQLASEAIAAGVTDYVVREPSPETDHATLVRRLRESVSKNVKIERQRRRERQIRGLYESMVELLDATSEDELCALVDRHLAKLPGIDAQAVYQYDATRDRLQPEPALESTTGGERAFGDDGPSAALVRQAFDQKRSVRFERSEDDATGSEIACGLAVPIGEHGVLAIGSRRPDAFDGPDETLLNLFATVLSGMATRIRNERELEAQNDRLGNFASIVSHDLRNPLSVADGYLELAQQTGSAEHLAEVENAHDRMERIIDDLLWLAREGRQIGSLRQTSLADVVDRAWEHTQAPGASFTADCTAEIAADPDRLQQLLENLFRNANEHAGPGVTIRVGQLGDGPDFYVEDDGPGIPSENREQVFESGYTTARDGTGYGLSIVETVVDAHGWNLRLTESDAGGARFEFRDVTDAVRAEPET